MVNTVGIRIKERRNELKMSQLDLAKAVNKSNQVVSNWERGYTPAIHHDDLVKIAEALKTTTDYLLGRDDKQVSSPQDWINQIPDAPKLDTTGITSEEVELFSFMRRGMSSLTPQQRKEKVELAKLALRMAEEMQKSKNK